MRRPTLRQVLGVIGVTAGAGTCPLVVPDARAVEYDTRSEAAVKRVVLVARAAAALDVRGATEVRLYGVPTIVVPRSAKLSDLRRAAPAGVIEAPRGVWTLRRTVVVTRGARLTIGPPEVRVLRLLSGPSRPVTLTAWGADLSFVGTPRAGLIVTSWDPRRPGPDGQIADARASVSSIGGGRLDARFTSFESLGFYPGLVSGVAVASYYGQPRGSGDLISSSFIGNYFGAYTFNAVGMRWLDDRFIGNKVYGLDPHDNSDRFLVRGSYAAHNGLHGIIFSRFCDRNVIVGNRAEHNGWHGIVLDDGKAADGPSVDNVVARNVVRDNGLVGISLDGSGANLIRDNHVSGGRVGIRVRGPTSGAVVARNDVAGTSDFGVLLSEPSVGTHVLRNRVRRTPTGVRVRRAARSVIAHNSFVRMTSHGVLVDPSGLRPTGLIARNRVQGSGGSPVEVLPGYGRGPRVVAGPTAWRYPLPRRIQHALSWVVGPGLWLLLGFVAIGGGAVIRTTDRLRRWHGAERGLAE
jgi:parallel beta-helix repeat protein